MISVRCEIMPCPFCVERTEVEAQAGIADFGRKSCWRAQVYCVCGAAGPRAYADTPEDALRVAVEKWNERR